MGLLNVSHANMTQSVIDLQADLLKNPFYLFNDKKGLPVDYYHIDKDRSTLDDTLRIQYADLGKDSPLRFNLIHDFYLYGIDRVALSLENGDFGVESSEISGDAIILPDTIEPVPGDYFIITMLKDKFNFKVTDVSMDTFDNGSNYWKIGYAMDRSIPEDLEPNIVGEFNFISGNVGTEFTPVLAAKKFDVCKNLDDVAVNMKQLFKGLYFNNKVQTYTFVYLYHVARTSMNSDFFYDPYMIEFCIRNRILDNSGDKYDFLDHKTTLRPEFNIKYSRSIWKILETREKDELPACKHSSAAAYIDDPGTIFSTRYEDYFELTYNNPDPVAEMFAPAIDIIDPQVIGHILENQLFDYNTQYGKYNILIKYFNYADVIETQDIIPLERIFENENNMENYFFIPMAIYVLEFYIKNLMARSPETSKSKTK